MATFFQTPGQLDLSFVRGDELTIVANFPNLNLTGYTLSAAIYTGVADKDVTVVAAAAVSVAINTSGGVTTSSVTINWSEASTAMVEPKSIRTIGYAVPRWYLRWVAPGSITRTVLSGAVYASNP